MQTVLGDNPVAQLDRKRKELEERTQEILDGLGENGLCKPKQVLEFFNDVKFKSVGGQQLTAICMYCGFGPIASTGATRLLLHLSKCSACPANVRAQVVEMSCAANKKRKSKQEAVDAAKAEGERMLKAERVRRL